MIVLGIDPGTAVTGFGVIDANGDRLRLVDAGVQRSPRLQALPDRILGLCGDLEDLLDRHRPGEVALEGLFAARNVRSALILAHLRGAYLLTLARSRAPVAEYSPRTVKQTVTGYGGATKQQVRAMVLRLLGEARQTRSAIPLDASDALAVAICHAHTRIGQGRRSRKLG